MGDGAELLDMHMDHEERMWDMPLEAAIFLAKKKLRTTGREMPTTTSKMKTGKIVRLKHVKEIASKDPQKYPEPSNIYKLQMDNGDTGEAWFPSKEKPSEGMTLNYEFKAPEREGWSAKIEIARERKQFAKGNGGGGWSKEKEASVMIQGLLKSVIESGAPKNEWSTHLAHALVTHDMALQARMAKAAKEAAKADEWDNVSGGAQTPTGDNMDMPF